ncbi:hypothetical protein DITRI_Ditri07aG0100000 [Diplodiscus trichospermus]
MADGTQDGMQMPTKYSVKQKGGKIQMGFSRKLLQVEMPDYDMPRANPRHQHPMALPPSSPSTPSSG